MAEQEGSKAMTVYIVVCFVLAAGGLIGYKLMEDKRAEHSTEYSALAGKIQDVGGALEPSIRDYYNKVQLGLIEPPDRAAMDKTHETLRTIAKDRVDIKEGSGENNQLEVTAAGAGKDKGTGKDKYKEYRCKVELRSVTQGQWKDFLVLSLDAVSKYAVVESITVDRLDRRADKIQPASGTDQARWNVTLEYVWFGPMTS